MKKNNNPDKIPLASAGGLEATGFFDNVYDVVRKIPKGRVTSYGAIAHYLGAKRSARMVGWALSVSHQTKPKVPAHRVVNRVGLLSGKHHFAEPGLMEKSLLKEKVLVKDDMIVDFKNLFWDPTLELAL